MGEATMSEAEVQDLIKELSKEWRGADYDLLRHNCVNFCDVLCQRLGVGSIPPWVKNLAGAGATIFDGAIKAVNAAQQAKIIAAAKAGKVDEKYNIRGQAQAKAQDFLAAMHTVNKTYQIKEKAAGFADAAKKGAIKAADRAKTFSEDKGLDGVLATAGKVAQTAAEKSKVAAQAATEKARSKAGSMGPKIPGAAPVERENKPKEDGCKCC